VKSVSAWLKFFLTEPTELSFKMVAPGMNNVGDITCTVESQSY